MLQYVCYTLLESEMDVCPQTNQKTNVLIQELEYSEIKLPEHITFISLWSAEGLYSGTWFSSQCIPMGKLRKTPVL